MGRLLYFMGKLLTQKSARGKPPPPAGPLPPGFAKDRVAYYTVPAPQHAKLGLWVSSVGRHRRQPPSQAVRGRIADFYAAVWISRGSGFYESRATGRVAIKGGTLMWVVPGVAHSYSADVETWDEEWVVFGGRCVEEFERLCWLTRKKPVVKLGDEPRVGALFDRLIECFVQGGPLCTPLAAGLVWQLVTLTHGLSQGLWGAASAESGSVGRSEESVVAAALRIIEAEAARGLTPEALAERVHAGYSTLRRRFKRQTGFSLKDYLLHAQLRKAKELLALSALSVHEVAREAGFADPLHFSRAFSERVGVSPREFRRMQSRAPQA